MIEPATAPIAPIPPLQRFAFIVKGPGYCAEAHAQDLTTATFVTRVVGVSDAAGACVAAQTLVADGFQLIELCGGFSAAEQARVQAAIADAVPIGRVSYSATETARLNASFGAPLG